MSGVRSISFMPRTIDALLGRGSCVNVRSFVAYEDGSGAPAVVEVTGYTYAFDYLGGTKCTLIGSPALGSRMASEGACRRARDAYVKLVRSLLTRDWFRLNAEMYPESPSCGGPDTLGA